MNTFLRCKRVVFVMQKCLFDITKQALLPCETMGFIIHWYRNSYTIGTYMKNIYMSGRLFLRTQYASRQM